MSTGWTIAFVLVAVVAIVNAVLLLALARYVATLARRLPQSVPLELEQGPEVGDPIGEITLPEGFGELAAEASSRGRTILAFLSTTCSSCASLVPHLSGFAREADGTRVIGVITGEGGVGDRMLEALDGVRAWRDASGRVAKRFGIETVPYALLYRDGTLAAKGVVNDREMLESLEQGIVRAHGDELLLQGVEHDHTHPEER